MIAGSTKRKQKSKMSKRASCSFFRENEMKGTITTGTTARTRTTPVPELERKSAPALFAANYREITASSTKQWSFPLFPLFLPSSSSCCVAAHHQPDPQFHQASFG
jgi:hypothetical protein